MLLVSFLSGCNSETSTNPTTTSTTTTTDTTPSSDVVNVAGLSLDISSNSLRVGESFSLTATIAPEDATDKSVTWSAINDKVTLSSTSGSSIIVLANSVGNSSVTATSTDGNFQASCSITISEQPVVSKIKLYVHDSKSLIDAVEGQADGNYVAITDTGIDDGVPYYNVDLSQNIRVHLSQNGMVTPTGLTINGVNHNLDESGYVSFVAYDEDFSFFSLTPLYTDTTPSTGDISFEVNETTHLSLEIYDSDTFNHKITSANAGDMVYVKVIPDDEDYFARSLSYTRRTNDIGDTYTSKATYDESLKVFKFSTPTSFNNVVTISMVEGNHALLKDSKLVGTYLTLWLTTSTKKMTSFENKNLVVSMDGSMARYVGQTPVRTDQVKTYTDNDFDTESYHTIPYGENYIFTSDRGSDGFYDPNYINYDLLCIKKANEDDLDNIYSVDGEKFKIDGKEYAVIRVYRNDVEYINFFLDYTNKQIKTGLAIKMIYGEHISDDKVMYTVSKDDVNLLSISYINDGGTANRIELVSPYGVYTGENGQFLLANDTVGVYDGLTLVAVLDGNTVTLTNASRRVVLTLNTSNNTYVVVLDEAIESHIPDLKNKVFTCHFYVDWDEGYSDLVFTFNNYSSDDNIQVTFTGYYSYSATFDATYDLDTNIITMTLINSTQSYNWITTEGYQVTALMANGKMTMKKDLNNVINFKNAVFNCPEFVL